MTKTRYTKPVPVWRTILVGIAFALAVGLPVVWLHEDPVTAPLVFPEGKEAGMVETVDCPFRVRARDGVRCVRAYVPQDHDDPASRVISIFAAVIEPEGGARRDDPFVYLEGGPGYASVYTDGDAYRRDGDARWFFQAVLDSGREVILVDTRGLGQGEPALRCPALEDVQWDELKRPPADRLVEREIVALETCLAALGDAGIDVPAYRSAQAGRDLAMLRAGLGIDQWNVYGVSYGAQTLLALLDVDRAGVRTAVFDSPSYGRLDFGPGDQAAFDRAVDIVSDLCTTHGAMDGDGARGAMFEQDMNDPCTGDTKERLASLLTSLDATPLTLRPYPLADPLYLTSREAISLLHETLYAAEGWRDFSYLLSHMQQAERGFFASFSQDNVDWYRRLSWAYRDDSFSYPVNLATTCAESNTGPLAQRSLWPLMTEEETRFIWRACEYLNIDWGGVRYDAAAYRGTPSLIVSGWRDVITPPSYGRELARDIGGHFVLNREEAHGVIFWAWQECELDMMVGFFDDPSARLDTRTCADRCRVLPPAQEEDAISPAAEMASRTTCREVDAAALSDLIMYLERHDEWQ